MVIGAARRRSIRGRLTAWYTATLSAALVAYAILVYLSLHRVLWAELDDRLHHEIETVEGLLQPFWSETGMRTPSGESPLDDDDDRWVQVWSRDGRLLFESDTARSQPIPQLPPPTADVAMSLSLESLGEFRVKDEAGHIAKYPVIVRAGTSERRVRDELAQMLALMLIALPICAAAAAYGGHRLVGRTLSPIDRLVSATSEITAEKLAQRLPVENPQDEVGQIATAFNATLGRLDTSFTQMRRFTANASHELRTPLAAMRSTGQVALTNAETLAEHREAIVSILEEVEHVSKLVNTLLLLARSDAGQIDLSLQLVDVSALVHDVTAECRVLAEEKHQPLVVDGAVVHVYGDPTVLRIAVANVVHNAIRHSPPGGRVTIRVRLESGTAVVDVEDDGPGIPAEHLDHIFERFYKLDPGRSSLVVGAGLGLAMARWAVAAHRGSISVRNNSSHGSTFSIVVPATTLPKKS